MKRPLVSIIMSTYNGSKYIEESIKSVLNQSYSNFEFIIINDFSTDNVEKIISKYQKKDNRIIYIKNEQNLKLTKSLNKWIKIAKWEYIARIDDDDIWLKEKLEKQINFMEENKDYWLCWTSTIIINSNWKEIEKIKMRNKNENIKRNILKSNQFIHSSIIMRKKILEEVWWFYDEKWNWAEDYELWLRIWQISKFYNLNEYLLKYRWLETSISRKNQKLQQINSIKLCLKYKKYYNLTAIALIYRISFYIATLFLKEEKIKKYLWKLKNKKWKKKY